MQFRLFYYKGYYFIICVNESGDEHTTFSIGSGGGARVKGAGPGASGVGRQDGEKRYFLTQFMKTNGRRDLLHTLRAVLLCVNPPPLACRQEAQLCSLTMLKSCTDQPNQLHSE